MGQREFNIVPREIAKQSFGHFHLKDPKECSWSRRPLEILLLRDRPQRKKGISKELWKNVWHACMQICHIIWRFFLFFFLCMGGGGGREGSNKHGVVNCGKITDSSKKKNCVCAAGVNVWRIQWQHFACTRVNYGSVLIFAKLCCVLRNDWVTNEWMIVMIVPMIKYCGRHFHWSLWNAWFLWLLFLFTVDIFASINHIWILRKCKTLFNWRLINESTPGELQNYIRGCVVALKTFRVWVFGRLEVGLSAPPD